MVGRCSPSPGCIITTFLSTHAQQDVEMDKLFEDVCCIQRCASWVRRTSRTSPTSRAGRAVTRHGVSHIAFPVDLQGKESAPEKGSMHNVLHHTSDVFAWSAGIAEEQQLRRAADVLECRITAGHPCGSRGTRLW